MMPRPFAPALAAIVAAGTACTSGIQTVRPAERPPLETRTVTPIPDVSDRAARLWRESIVIDTHVDMPTKVLDDGYDPDVRHAAGFGATEGHVDLPRLTASGITAVWMSAWVDAPYALTQPDSSFERAMLYVDSIRAFTARHPDRLILATTAAEVERAKGEGKVAIFIGVEGGHAIESSLDNLRALYGRGVRYLTLTWNNGNAWAGSSVGLDSTSTGGLTDFGREVVREMNRLGMLVDLSHVSEQTFHDAIATTSRPVIASHSSARALNDHPRNLTDDQLRAIARNGGVAQMVALAGYVKVDPPEKRAAIDSLRRALGIRGGRGAMASLSAEQRAAYQSRMRDIEARWPGANVADFVNHIDHAVKVAGIDHVGISSDFDGGGGITGWRDASQTMNVTAELIRRGYSEQQIRKLWGENLLRVWSAQK